MLLSLLLLGCTCGNYTAKTGYSEDGDSFDRDDYIEACGVNSGVGGSFDLLGDGFAWLDFAPGHRRNAIDWLAVSLDLELTPPNAALVEGAHLTEMNGVAFIASATGNRVAIAPLTRVALDVLAVRPAEEPCTPFRAQEFQLQWDAEWGNPEDEYYYTAAGKDWVSLSLDGSSSDPECL